MTSSPTAQSRQKRQLVACGCFRSEIETLRCPDEVQIRYLPQSLHRSPERLRESLQQVIDEVATSAAEIVLGYGLCSNGLVGLRARQQPLIVPRVHDCIALLMGSRTAYQEAFARRPGSYYLTRGWIDHDRDPLGTLEQDYVPRVGREDAEWALREELKNYTHLVYLRTKADAIGDYQSRAAANARFLEKELAEVESSAEYLERLLTGPHEHPDFCVIPPGAVVTQSSFFD